MERDGRHDGGVATAVGGPGTAAAAAAGGEAGGGPGTVAGGVGGEGGVLHEGLEGGVDGGGAAGSGGGVSRALHPLPQPPDPRPNVGPHPRVIPARQAKGSFSLKT